MRNHCFLKKLNPHFWLHCLVMAEYQSESDDASDTGLSFVTISDSVSPMSSTSSLPKPQLPRISVPSAPRAIPNFRRFCSRFSRNGKMAMLDRSLAAIGTEWTSSDPLDDDESETCVLKISPRSPTCFPNIEG